MRHSHHTWARLALIICSLVVLCMISAPAGLAQDAATPDVVTPGDGAPCADGRLRIRDLELADSSLSEGLEAIRQRAEQWQSDARLVELRLACPLLTTGLVWEGTFFSETAQANFSTDTADVEPAEEAPEDVPYLDVDGVSFQAVYRSLLRAGFSEDLLLAPASSVTVRLSTDENSFGPTTAPRGFVYVHVAIEERGQVKDVWVNASDGTIYRYE